MLRSRSCRIRQAEGFDFGMGQYSQGLAEFGWISSFGQTTLSLKEPCDLDTWFHLPQSAWSNKLRQAVDVTKHSDHERHVVLCRPCSKSMSYIHIYSSIYRWFTSCEWRNWSLDEKTGGSSGFAILLEARLSSMWKNGFWSGRQDKGTFKAASCNCAKPTQLRCLDLWKRP